jgi:hypothetical protein
MSLTMMALRICAVEALKAAGTLVGDNVLDSEIAPIDMTADGRMRTSQDAPFIAVYTDGATSSDLQNTGLRSNGQVDLVFSYGVSRAMQKSNKQTGQAEIIDGIPVTDAHFEAVMDVLGVQISRVLVDPDNEWAQVLSELVLEWSSKEQLRSGSKIDAVRVAAGQLKFSVQTVADPYLGQVIAPATPWGRFLALLEQEGLTQLELFRSALGVPAEGLYPPFEQLLGAPTCDVNSMLLYTFGGAPKTATVVDSDPLEGPSDV